MNIASKLVFSCFIAFAAAISPQYLFAAPGSPDTSFHSTGGVDTDIYYDDVVNATAVQSDGKVVVAGRSSISRGGDQVTVARYTVAGDRDMSFNSGAPVLLDLGDFYSGAYCLTIQSDGKIIVAGYYRISGYGAPEYEGGSPVYGQQSGCAVIRLLSTGALDPDFGTGGIVKTISPTFTINFDYLPHAVAVDSDGKIVIAGNVGNYCHVWRYTSAGVLDTGFDKDGFAYAGSGEYGSQFNGIAIQPDGKIVAAGTAGYYGSTTQAHVLLARFNPADGSLDGSFGTGGVVDSYLLTNYGGANAIALRPDGKILIAGMTAANGDAQNPTAEHLVARYTSAGVLDTTFDTDGIVTFGFTENQEDLCLALSLQPDGRIVTAGYASDGARLRPVLARLTAAGKLDTSFGDGGKLVDPLTPTGAGAFNAAALRADGRIIAAGYSTGLAVNSNVADFAIRRFNGLARADVRVGATSSATRGNGVFNKNGTDQDYSLTVPVRSSDEAYANVQNDGNDSDTFRIHGKTGNNFFKVQYYQGLTEITASVVAGTYTTPTIAKSAVLPIRVKVTAKTKTQVGKTYNITVTSTSVNDPTSADTGLIKVRVTK